MKRMSCNRAQVSVGGGFFVYVAALLLLVPVRWVAAAVLSAAVHELFHIAAIRLLGLQVTSVRVGLLGAKIHTQPMSDLQELTCALAGPIGGLSLLLFARWLPATSICAGFQSLYNLLPVYPADGGRILRCGARLLLPAQMVSGIVTVVETLTLAGIAFLAIYGTFRLRLGALPLAIGGILIYAASRKK